MKVSWRTKHYGKSECKQSHLRGGMSLSILLAIPSANIREGVTILGVEGAMSGSEDMKPQSKEVTPSKEAQTIMPDEEYNCLSQVTVKAIPYVETDNSAGGKTVTIG